MRVLTLLIVSLVLSVLLAKPTRAEARSYVIPHKPIHQMTIDQVLKFQNRVIFHDRSVIRFWINHPKARKVTSFRVEEKFSEHRLVWTLRELAETRERIAERARQRAYHALLPQWLITAFTCIHGYEGAWNSNTGNGYYGGMQMDGLFQSTYGPEFVKAYGSADNWPIRAQLIASARAYHSGRGFGPWPNTARACGLL